MIDPSIPALQADSDVWLEEGTIGIHRGVFHSENLFHGEKSSFHHRCCYCKELSIGYYDDVVYALRESKPFQFGDSVYWGFDQVICGMCYVEFGKRGIPLLTQG